MERKLASIVKISDIQPIPGADAIEVASVKGWKVVVKKNEFKPGDLAIYFEIDSFLPIKPEFEFLRKSSYRKLPTGEEGFRLKTIRLRGQISQGLLLPDNTFSKEGDDLTEELGVKKYEIPIPVQLAGNVAGVFPSFIPKTDEERIQNITENYSGERVYITEKLEGTSFTAYYKDGKFGICMRNYELKEDDNNAYWLAAKKMNLREKMIKYGKNIALQGELIGPGIQSNIYRLRDIEVMFFTGYDIEKGRRMYFDELEWILFGFDLEMVPVIETNYILPSDGNLTEFMLKYADGKSMLNEETDREGVVVRGLEKEFSFKAVSNNYLLSSN